MRVVRSLISGAVAVSLVGFAAQSPAKVRSDRRVSVIVPSESAKATIASPPTPVAVPVSSPRMDAAITGLTMKWYSMPGGGVVGGASSQFGLSSAAGQSVIGEGANTGLRAGIGFYHGIGTCECDYLGDLNDDGFYDSIDLNIMISALFFNGPTLQDPHCPTSRTDLNCSMLSDSVDLNILIALLFFNGPPPCDACTGQPAT